MSLSRLSLLAAVAVVFAACPSLSLAGNVEAIPGKKYRVTKQHGPWMILVATLHKQGDDRPDELEEHDETVAREAADALVLELRQMGVPAYVFELKKERATVITQSRSGELQKRRTLADDSQISVLAGNYTSIDDEVARKTLAVVKRFYPRSFGDKANFRPTPGRQGPLGGAFLTANPLLSRTELLARTVNPEQIKLLKKLNAANEYPITKCGGDYTLVIKEFKSRSGMKPNASVNKKFDLLQAGQRLGQMGYDAWELCTALRNRGVDAHLWHEEFRSVVTVGGFTGPNDPRLAGYMKKYGAEQYRDPQTGIVQVAYKSEPPMANGKMIPVNGDGKAWLFDLKPQLMAVPTLKAPAGSSSKSGFRFFGRK